MSTSNNLHSLPYVHFQDGVVHEGCYKNPRAPGIMPEGINVMSRDKRTIKKVEEFCSNGGSGEFWKTQHDLNMAMMKFGEIVMTHHSHIAPPKGHSPENEKLLKETGRELAIKAYTVYLIQSHYYASYMQATVVSVENAKRGIQNPQLEMLLHTHKETHNFTRWSSDYKKYAMFYWEKYKAHKGRIDVPE